MTTSSLQGEVARLEETVRVLTREKAQSAERFAAASKLNCSLKDELEAARRHMRKMRDRVASLERQVSGAAARGSEAPVCQLLDERGLFLYFLEYLVAQDVICTTSVSRCFFGVKRVPLWPTKTAPIAFDDLKLAAGLGVMASAASLPSSRRTRNTRSTRRFVLRGSVRLRLPLAGRADFRALGDALDSVAALDFCGAGAHTLGNNGAKALAQSCRSLVGINLRGCNSLGDAAVEALCTQCPCLTSLGLSGCDLITDMSLSTVGTNVGSRLVSLDVSECHDLTDAGMLWIARHCPRLRTLLVVDCGNFTDAAVMVRRLRSCCSRSKPCFQMLLLCKGGSRVKVGS